MATILSSKSFIVDKAAKFPLELVEEWFKDNLLAVYGIKSDLRFVVTLETYGDARKKKNTALAELNSLLAGATDCVIKFKGPKGKHTYCFDFYKRKYLWNENEIYLTAGEQLFLYRWLMLKNEMHKALSFYLRNMRRRLGKEFFSDTTEKNLKGETR